MSRLQQILTKLSAIAAWSRTWPYAGRTAFALALGTMLLLITQGHHLDNPAEVVGYESRGGTLVAINGVSPAGPLLKTVSVILPYLDQWMLFGGAVYIFILLRQWGNVRKLILPTWVASPSVAAWAVCRDLAQQIGTMQMTEMGEPPALAAYWLKLVLLSIAALCIPALLHYYHRSQTLARYTLRTFLAPLVFCFVAFTSLWLIMDLLDNLKDFQEAETSIGRVMLFYVGVLPFIFISVMPPALLLAVLYTLTKMSRANEIVAMLGSGRSVLQILQPLFIVSVGVATLSFAANYYWAPRAEGNKEAILRGLEGRQKDSIMQSSLMYRDPHSQRLWYVASFPFSLREGRLRSVLVREQDAAGHLTRAIHADSAMWWPSGVWRFYDGKEVLYSDGAATSIKPFPIDENGRSSIDISTFEETPWSMVSYALQPDYMSVPEIVSYLKAHPKDTADKLAPFRAHYHQRFALPWQSFALVLVAAPLGIAYSRRGAVGGIAGSIFIFFALLFLNNLCLNLGRGAHLPAWFSPWIPHLLFGVLGLTLLHYRSQNKDLPRLNLGRWFAKKTRIARPRNRSAA